MRILTKFSLLAPLMLLMSLDARSACTTLSGNVKSFCSEDITFSGSTSVWGPQNQSPPDKTVSILNTGWNQGGRRPYKTSFSPFGTFGGSLNMYTHGHAGLYFGIRDMQGGRANLNYTAKMYTEFPQPNAFLPGEKVKIHYYNRTQESSSLSTNGSLTAGNISLWAELGMSLSAGAEICFIDCVGDDLPDISLSSLQGATSLPLPPGVPGGSGELRQTVFELPVGSNYIIAGPLREVLNSNLLQGNCPQKQIESKEYGKIHQKSGISGCVGFPQLPQSSQRVNYNDLQATRTHKFLDLDVDIDFWASKIKTIPPMYYSQKLGHVLTNAGDVWVDALDLDANSKLSLKQTLTYKPNTILQLDFPIAIDYTISNYDGFVSAGSGTSVQLRSEESLEFIAPDQVLNINTTYIPDNTFSNDSELIYEISTKERIATAGFNLKAQILGFSSVRICKPWPSYSCWSPGIYSPVVNFVLGPIKSWEQPVKTLRDSSLFDNNQPPWKMSMPSQPGAPIVIDPPQPPVLFVQGVPTTTIDEGSSFQVSTVGSYDPDAPLAVVRLYAYVGGGATQYLSNYPYNENNPFNVTVKDNGNTILSFVAPDTGSRYYDFILPSTDKRFYVNVANVAPTVSVNDVSGSEGAIVSLPVTVSDPGVLDTQMVRVDWGDGSNITQINLGAGGGIANFEHVYADNGLYGVEACATDDDGGVTCKDVNATISNEAPQIGSMTSLKNITPDSNGDLLLDLQLTVNFSDPGTLDTHTATLQWSHDNSIESMAVFQAPFGPPGSTSGQQASFNTIYNLRAFSAAGTITTQVCVEDDDSAKVCTAGPDITIPASDLSITGSYDPNPNAEIGAPMFLNYSVSNSGPDRAENVAVTVKLPEGANDRALTGNANSAIVRSILASDLAAQEANFDFGTAVAVSDSTLIVGAPGTDVDPSLDAYSNEGAVYVYNKIDDNWLFHAKLTASNAQSGDKFGTAVAISDDGSRLLIGAPTTSAYVKGQAYVFVRNDNGTPLDQSDDSWSEEAILSSNDLANGAQFGNDVAIEDDIAVVGAWSDDYDVGSGIISSGSVLIFEHNASNPNDPWPQSGYLHENTPHDGGFFGEHVAIENARVAAVSGDGGDNIPFGRIALFEKLNGSWQSVQEINATALSGDPDGFAKNGIVMDGDHLIALTPFGAFSTDRIEYLHAFHYVNGHYVINTQIPVRLGKGVGLDANHLAMSGSADLNGTYSSGSIQNFNWNGSEWEAASLMLPYRAEDRTYATSDNSIAVIGDDVFVGKRNSPQLSKNNMGVVLRMQACRENASGEVVCGLGALGSGESRDISVSARVGCSVANGSVLTSEGSVGADVIEPDTSNNITTLNINTVLLSSNQCGVDLDPPRIEVALNGVLGDNGWYRSDVDINWSVSDPDSNINNTTGCDDSTQNSDAANAQYICNALSDGGSSSESVFIKKDATPPSITPVVTGTLGTNGWFVSPFTLSFNCSDTLSGIASCEPSGVQSMTQEGLEQNITARAVDNAGNSATLTQEIKLDTTPPYITASKALANAYGWYRSDVSIDFTCNDDISGIAQCPVSKIISSEGENQIISAVTQDNAGLSTTKELNVSIDKTPPTLNLNIEPTASSFGWYRQFVSVTPECHDALSGVLECPEVLYFRHEGANQTQSLQVSDLAGNSKTQSVPMINIDMQAPSISATISPLANADGLRALPVTISFTCNDSLSGIASCPQPVVINTSVLGHSLSAVAIDKAGNEKEITVSDINAGIAQLSNLQSDLSVTEGEFISGSLAQVSAVNITQGIAEIDWGDGNSETLTLQVNGDEAQINVSHAYAQNGSYVTNVKVPLQMGQELSHTFNVDVSNAAPVIGAFEISTDTQTPSAPLLRSGSIALQTYAKETFSLSIFYSDPGSADTHSASVDWGDGTTDTNLIPVATQSQLSQGEMNGTIVASHLYNTTGTYQGRVCIKDDAQAETCQDFSMAVNTSLVSINNSSCSISAGNPTVGTNETVVPLYAYVSATNVSSVVYSWESSEPGYSFDDNTSQTPTITMPRNGNDPLNLGVSLAATLAFENGSSETCVTTYCAKIDSNGQISPCQLKTSFLDSIAVPTLSRFAMILFVIMILIYTLRNRKLWELKR